MSFENELGVLKPVGFWDPLGLSNGITQEKFDQYRTAELKHGRVSQLAVIGYLAQENFRIAGYLSPVDKLKFDDVTNGVAAITQVPVLGWLQLIALVGFFESVSSPPRIEVLFGLPYCHRPVSRQETARFRNP